MITPKLQPPTPTSALDRPIRRAAPVLVAFAGAAVLLALVISRIDIRTDMAEFLPRGTTEASRAVLDELRSGTTSGLVLTGIEGADASELARISRQMAATLQTSGAFELVAGGEASIPDTAIEALFARRYLLADADWTEPAIQRGLERLLRQLNGVAAPLIIRFAIADPPGTMLTVFKAWTSGSRVRAHDGAWFAPDRPPNQQRALLLARTKAAAMDVPGQERAIGLVERAFLDAHPESARLLLTGPAVFARDAARAIKSDVRRLTLASTLLVALLLWWRFRSPLVIAAIATPVIASIAAAAAAVQLGFGSVHGVALGFGATMLGISVDYPVLMLGHRKRGEPAPATRARIGRAFILAVATATIGLSAMVFSGFPGLVQLGVFSAVGLLVCALFTWFGLPALIVRANLAPAAAGSLVRVARLERLRHHRVWALIPVAAAAIYLIVIGGPRWQGDLAALSPVPAADLALDRSLRADLGTPDEGQLLLVSGADPEAVLQAEERVLPTLDRLQSDGVLAGVEAAAILLPSANRQRQRATAIPDRATLHARIDSAMAALPFRPDAFDQFLTDAEVSSTLPPLTLPDLAGTPLRARLEPLLLHTPPPASAWRGPLVLHGVTDKARLEAAIHQAGPDTLYVDMRAELGRILSDNNTRAWRWLAGSAVAMLIVLLAGLRDWRMAPLVIASVLAAMLVTVALLTAVGETLSLIHLVALQLVAGVGLDYALFFARRQLDAEERARTVRTLVTCNAMTLLTFGMLALCNTPLLREIGVTVALGAVLAMISAFFVTGERAA